MVSKRKNHEPVMYKKSIFYKEKLLYKVELLVFYIFNCYKRLRNNVFSYKDKFELCMNVIT